MRPDSERRESRLWSQAAADSIVAACRGKVGSCDGRIQAFNLDGPWSIRSDQSCSAEANGRFGFSAKNTLGIAQSLYERHKVLTYPRTDSRHLPEDYVDATRETVAMLGQGAYRTAAQLITKSGWIKPNKRIFDNSKISDHFAIIPTLQEPKNLSEPEAKLYDLVVKRFLAVFFPGRRISCHHAHYRGHRSSVQDRGQGTGQSGLAAGVRQGSARRRRQPGAGCQR